jgi:hypothetical protein
MATLRDGDPSVRVFTTSKVFDFRTLASSYKRTSHVQMEQIPIANS